MKTILVDAVHTFVIVGEGIFESMHALLEKYPNKKIVLTSANDEQIEKFGLDNLPYEYFTLKHDPEKSDPAYYKKMLEHFDFSPEELIYFEHNEEAVKCAASVGITSYHYDKEEHDLEALQQFLEANL